VSKGRKLWAGRFRQETDAMVEAFTSSLAFDRRLFRHDIRGSIAHAKMLGRCGIIDAKARRAIIKGLEGILNDMEEGRFVFRPEDEDIHMAVEKALIERIGSDGARLHTGRSRNDQVALDLRLYLREEIDEIIGLLRALRGTLVEVAGREAGTVMPGYTHLQRAQPVLFSHYLLAYHAMFERDEGRLADARKRVDVMPLGSGALAGSGLPLDRRYTARLLGFSAVADNSMDAVSDRDFVAEFIFASALVMAHLSRFCEDLILYSTAEFDFIEISDAFTTGSSMMPQKKNPDVAELIRGKTGRVYGNLAAILTVLKGLPMTYNRDLQEDKEALFDTVDTLKASLAVFGAMMSHVRVKGEKMAAAAAGGFSAATDIAEYLVSKGVPFREAHGIVGRIVAYCIDEGKSFPDLRLEDFRRFHDGFDEEVLSLLTPEASVARKRTQGSTAPSEVARRIEALGRRDK